MGEIQGMRMESLALTAWRLPSLGADWEWVPGVASPEPGLQPRGEAPVAAASPDIPERGEGWAT